MYMVQAMIDISEQAKQGVRLVKAQHNLKDKSQAIERVLLDYGAEMLEPKLRPEFVEKMKGRQSEPTVRIANFRKHFGLD